MQVSVACSTYIEAAPRYYSLEVGVVRLPAVTVVVLADELWHISQPLLLHQSAVKGAPPLREKFDWVGLRQGIDPRRASMQDAGGRARYNCQGVRCDPNGFQG